MKLLFCIATLVLAASAAPLYTRSSAPAGWIKGEKPCPVMNSISFTLALKQQNMDQLDDLFHQISTPGHVNYRKFLNIEQIRNIINPEEIEVEAIVQWLEIRGVRSIKNMGDALDIECPVGVAEELFNTEFFYFTHQESGAQVIRAWGDYSIPEAFEDLIELVVGISTFPVPHLKYHVNTDFPNLDDGAVIPQTCQKIYSVPAETFGNATKTDQSVVEFQGQSYDPEDLSNYGKACNIQVDVPSSSHTVGPNNPSLPQTEALLDIEIMATVNNEAEQWFWLESGNGWLYQFAIHFFNTSTVPAVNSISYGWSESDQCQIAGTECSILGVDSQGYVNRVNNEFKKIGLRGISLLSASGDSGANGRTDESCSNDKLHPAFPGASPYVTTVGATQLNDATALTGNLPPICNEVGMQCLGGGTEVAVSFDKSNFASGGGFSQYENTPDWQKDAVNKYLNSGVALPPAGYYNGQGRGFPDIAALGHNVIISQNENLLPVGGTSASTPIVSAIIALLNQEAQKKDGKPLGFLNPLLYKMHAECSNCFTDVTVGDNKCTESGCNSQCQGFECAPGWDPVTGLGTPNYDAMKQYIMSQL